MSEAECCTTCSQGNPNVTSPRSGGGGRVADRLRGAEPGLVNKIRASDAAFGCKGAGETSIDAENSLTKKFPRTRTNQHEEDERESPPWCRAPT